MHFQNPWLLLLILLLAGVYFYQLKRNKSVSILFSDVERFKLLEDKKTKLLIQIASFIRYAVLILIVIALARPQQVNVFSQDQTEGVDIMLALDVSGSMASEDFKPKNRLEVAKLRIEEFINKRKHDRIGLVVFSKEAFTQSPLTVDYAILRTFLGQMQLNMGGEGTAIGMAIVTALNRLKESEAKSKVIVLLTDGENNSGQIDPLSAADLAKKLGVKIYTIGVGKEGGAPIPYDHPVLGKQYIRNPDGSLVLTTINEEVLKDISNKTNGTYFRAFDEKHLEEIYSEIDRLEKHKIETQTYRKYRELFMKFVGLAFMLLVLECLISQVLLIQSP